MTAPETKSVAWFSGPRALFVVLAVLALARVILSFVQVPPEVAAPLGLVVSATFFALPILGLFFASRGQWSPKQSLLFVGAGVLVHVLFTVAFQQMRGTALADPMRALAQAGLITWCAGLGALLASVLKDRNLVVPVALFLAGFDVFLVTYPLAPTRAVVEKAPQVLESVGYNLPSVAVQGSEKVGLPDLATVGPADFFFLFMFFVCLHKFGLRSKPTLIGTIIALVLYLLVVLLFGDQRLGPISLGALPVLLPIGAVFLAVNAREFKMNGEEKALTAIVALIALGLGWFGVNAASKAKASPTAPSPLEGGPAAPGSEGSPVPAPPSSGP